MNIIKRLLNERRLNRQRDDDVSQRYFLFFIVKYGTNVRKRSENGNVIVYSSIWVAEDACDIDDDIIRVSVYYEIYRW